MRAISNCLSTLGLKAHVLGALFAATTIAACFPSLPPEEEDDVGTDVQVAEDLVGTDAQPDVIVPIDEASPLPDAEEDTSTPPPDLSDSSVAPEVTDVETPPDDTDAGPTLNACGGTGILTGAALGTQCGACLDGAAQCDPTDINKNSTICVGATAQNACGGCGVLLGEAPGADCGVCIDGESQCDATDPDNNRTVCVGASTQNACGGCGPLAYVLEAPCGGCGVGACQPDSGGNSNCVEPAGGCFTPLTCGDLNCGSSNRTCVSNTPTEDAYCDACLPGFVDSGTACQQATTTPTNVVATTNLADKVSISWDASPSATAYRVYRCDKATGCAVGDWSLVPNGEIARTSYDDAGTTAASEPSAPSVTATTDKVLAVTLSWGRVANPVAKVYSYRVTAVAPAGETAPSAIAAGSRASRIVTGYELKIGDGAWTPIGDVLTFDDAGAPAPTLTAGTATASKGIYANYVALALSGTSATRGASVSYGVRAVTSTGTGLTSNAATGYRAAPTSWAIAWERSAAASSADFAAISGATGNTYNDTDAPSDGSVRFYRAVVTAANTATGTTTAVAGSRLPPPGVPGNVAATTENENAVVVTWQAVPEAIGYRVYRDNVLLNTAAPITATTYTDTGIAAPSTSWAAPANLTASINSSSQVSLSWSAPTRPQGPAGSYQVLAVNNAGDGPKSAAVTGRRSLPALVGYEVETSWTGSPAAWTNTQSLTAGWTHTNAPAGVITPGTATATDGDFMAKVALSLTGHSVSPTVVDYRVRGVLETGAKTAITAAKTGYRSVGSLTFQWQYAFQPVSLTWTDFTGARSTVFDDTSAFANGSGRYYRVALTATGATSTSTASVLGRRLAFVDVSVGGAGLTSPHTCALTNNGRVWCWGEQQYGALGNGLSAKATVSPVRVAAISNADQVSAGPARTCAKLGDKTISCWGANTNGELGDGTTTNSAVPVQVSGITTAKSVSTGILHTCSTLTTGQARCWGNNGAYQLGNGNTTNSLTPVTVRSSASVALTNISAIAASHTGFTAHSCAVLTNGEGRCWGDLSETAAEFGYLGAIFTTYSGFPVKPATVSNFSQITTGALSSCGATSDGQVFCWGENNLGQLGIGNYDNKTTPQRVSFTGALSPEEVHLGDHWACSLSIENTGTQPTTREVRCWGDSIGTSPSGSLSNLAGIVKISVGGGLACGVVDNTIRCWGKNLQVQAVAFP